MQPILFLIISLCFQNPEDIQQKRKSPGEINSAHLRSSEWEANAFTVRTFEESDPGRAQDIAAGKGREEQQRGPGNMDERLAVIIKSAEDWNRGDIEAFVQSYEQSPETTFVGTAVSQGTENILARYRRSYPDRERMGKLTFSELQARALSPTLAIVTGRFTLERTPEAGGKATGLFTLVMRRGANGWRIIHDHTSSSQR